MDVPLSWIIIIVCLLANFFFSAGETALVNVNRFKMQVEADEGSKTAKLVLHVAKNYDRALITVLIGINIVTIIASTVSTVLFYNLLISMGLENETISIISSIFITLLFYVIGDTLPKTIARTIPDTLSKILVYPIYFFMLILFPITYTFDKLTKLIETAFKVKEEVKFDEEDFESVIEKVSEEGVIEEEQGDIIQSALEFTDTNVKEVLTPRNKIFALNIRGLTKEQLHEIIVETNYSRIPVYEGEFDNIIGVLHIKTYLSAYLKNPNVSIKKELQKPYFVSSDIMIDDLFTGFKKNHTHIALVRNEKNKIIGMVTMDDVLEELVSDISEPNHEKGLK
ncbi:MAG TPA: HlyC/CorC family transporter [Erysipelotrichaceae bacterium]|nr:HlyC/CorC family transporter [Erysipelotrichaceae bacterium]